MRSNCKVITFEEHTTGKKWKGHSEKWDALQGDISRKKPLKGCVEKQAPFSIRKGTFRECTPRIDDKTGLPNVQGIKR